MTKAKDNLLVFLAIILAFSLGYFYNGYKIYKSQFNYIGTVTEALK